MFTRLPVLALFTAGLLLTSGCISINVNGANATWATNDLKTISGNGHISTQNRNVGMFTAINKNGSVDMILQKGDTPRVQIIADNNLQDDIITDVNNGVLFIKTKNDINIIGSHRLLAVVTAPDINSLVQDGSGDVKIRPFTFANLQINKNGSGDLSIQANINQLTWNQNGSGDGLFKGNIGHGNLTIDGSGDVKLEGSADYLQLSKNGSGDLSAFDMPVKQMQLNKDGSGDASILVTDSLNTEMRGSGDIYAKGNPAGDVNVKGSGDFHHVP
jgi:Putative auto-transporter adhesin, head GIN domain